MADVCALEAQKSKFTNNKHDLYSSDLRRIRIEFSELKARNFNIDKIIIAREYGKHT